MIETIILVEDYSKAKIVFDEKTMQEKINVDYPIRIYTKQDLYNDKSHIKNVKFIFSTWNMPKFSLEEIKDLFPSIEAVFYAAGSVKYFAEPFLQCGVKIFSAAYTNGIPVAEFTASQVILANKGYFQAQKAYKKPLYTVSFNHARRYSNIRKGNYCSKVGLIGLGMVGRNVLRLLKNYDFDVLAVDPYITKESMSNMGCKKVELNELFSNCDVISNHLPNIKETKGILNYDLFSLMKKSATFINTGRGAQIIEKDLIRALKEEPERCALLDVTSHEPIWPWSKLLRMKNVFLTPHIAGSTGNEESRLAESMYQAYNDYINCVSNEYEVTLNMLEKMA